MSEVLTILRAYPSQAMTKTLTAAGVIVGDKPKYFEVLEKQVESLRDLSVYLTKLEKESRCCVIRGVFKGPDFARTIPERVDAKGRFARKKDIFTDPARRFLMIDVDGFEPEGIVAVKEPVKAAEQYISKYLPEEFQDVSFHWQLSSSAGAPGKEHLLKVHLWFWLETPYMSHELTAWAKSVNESLGVKAIDISPLRVVQPHFTANPILKDGIADPVEQRSGFVEGFMGDNVHLKINEVTLLRSVDYLAESDGFEFVDPADKPGPIGAFHKAFTVEEVLDRWLSDEFVFEAGSDRRLTWLNGGGALSGCFITDDRKHFGSTHSSDPFDNRVVNLFDLVRHYVYGHLDEGLDAFELLDLGDRPSQIATINMLLSLPEVQDELAKEESASHVQARSLRDNLISQINEADTESTLRERVCAAIRSSHTELHKVDLDILARALQVKLNALTAIKPTVSAVRELISPIRREVERPQGLPAWAHGYFYVSSQGKLFRYDSDEWLTRESFDFKHNPAAGVDEDGFQLSAYNLLRDNPLTPRVEKAIYMPHLGHTFELDGDLCVNRYRPSSTPVAKPREEWSEKDHRAVALVRRHFEILCSERAAVTEGLLDWLAYSVQFPGIKMRYSWLIWGGEGAGKTWIGKLMASVMGGPNVRLVAVRDVLNETFNSWADGAVLSVIEEIRITGHRKDAWDNLKEPLTNDKLTITKKGLDPYQAPNVTNYIMFSNHFDAVPINLGSRRVGVIEVPFNGDDTLRQLNDMAVREGFASQTEYFDALFDCVSMHGPALRTWFLDRTFSEGFNPQGWAPATEEREAMALAGVSEEEDVARAAIEKGSYWVTDKVVSPGHLRSAMALWDDDPVQLRNENMPSLLSRLGFKKYKNRIKIDGKAVRVWTRNLDLTGCVEGDNKLIKDELHRSTLPGTKKDEAGTSDFDDEFLK